MLQKEYIKHERKLFSDAYFVISNPENNEDFTMAIIRELNGHSPKFGENCFIAENAAIIGEVEMGDNCSIWYGAVLRGDVHYIKIGNNVNIQDNATIHATYKKSPIKYR